MNTPINDGGPAFPHDELVRDVVHTDGKLAARVYYASPGMTLRDWFAGQIAGHLVSNSNQNPDWIRNASKEEQAKVYAENAYSLADAMIAAREKGGAS